jgi:hypothetical protein
MENPSHIVPVMVGDAKKCKWISDILLDNYGIYVQPINYPTVPVGTERLRITPTPMHSEDDIRHLVESLCDLWSQCALSRAVAWPSSGRRPYGGGGDLFAFRVYLAAPTSLGVFADGPGETVSAQDTGSGLLQADGHGVGRRVFHPAEFWRLHPAGGMAVAWRSHASGIKTAQSLKGYRSTADRTATLYLEPVSIARPMGRTSFRARPKRRRNSACRWLR